MAILISILLFIGYLYLIYSNSKDFFQILNQQQKKFQLLYCIAVIIPGILLVFLLKDERFFYSWDTSGYWVKSAKFSKSFFDNPFISFESIYNSIRHDEYNLLANLLLAPANKFLGINFEDYVFSVYLVYFLPISILISNICVQTFKSNSDKILILPFIILIFTPFLIPIRYGFIDIVGLVPIFIIINLLIKSTFLQSINFKSSIIIGLMMLLLVFSRRWYSFWAVSFYFSIFIINLAFSIKRKDYKILLNTCINLFIAGIIPVGLILSFFYPFFEMSLLKDYQDLYSGFRGSSYQQQFLNFILFFGVLIIILASTGGYFLWKRSKLLLFFLVFSTSLLLFLFLRINDLGGYQHFYLIVPLISILSFVFISEILLKNKKNIFYGISILIIINYIFVFSINTNGKPNYFFSSVDGKAKNRSDYYEIQNISRDLKTLQDEGKTIYSLASSKILNNDLLQNTQMPENPRFLTSLLSTQHVDKRDKFPNDLLWASYVLVTNPVQLHLRPQNQELIVYFNEEILNGSLKKHYIIEKKYTLMENVEILLLKKISPFSSEELKRIKNHFKNKYPDHPTMYEVNSTIAQISSYKTGNAHGKVVFESDQFMMHPGGTDSTIVNFNLTGMEKELKFTTTFKNKKSFEDAGGCNADNDGEVFLYIIGDKKLLKKYYVTHKADIQINLPIHNLHELTLAVDKGKNEDYCDWFTIKNLEIK